MSIKRPEADDPQADLAIFGSPSESPEKDLMVAIVTQAKLDLFHPNKRRSEMALAWFLETNVKLGDRPWLFSFQNICEQLDLDPEIIRWGILSHKEHKPDVLTRCKHT